MSAGILKWIAMISMAIDHVGVVFGPWLDPEIYTLMRALGRTAFPIYAFLLVEGSVHTRNAPKYLLRLLLFAVISEIPFDLAFYNQEGALMYWVHQNIFVTLAIGLGAIMVLDRLKRENKYPLKELLYGAIAILACLMADVFQGDYGFLGVCLTLLFYFTRGYRIGVPLALLAWLAYYDWSTGFVMELYGVPAALFVGIYNGRKGETRLPKWFFYGFYPAHLLILALMRHIFLG